MLYGRDPKASSRRGFASVRPRKVSVGGAFERAARFALAAARAVPKFKGTRSTQACISPGGGVVVVVCSVSGWGEPCHLVPAAAAAAHPTLLDVYHCRRHRRRVPTNGRRRIERCGGRWRVAVKRAHCDREPRTLVRSRPGNVVRRTPKLGRIAHRQCCYRVILRTCEFLPTPFLDILINDNDNNCLLPSCANSG